MYHDLAHLWPLISPPENYEGEARQWREALRESLGPGRHHLLELGVGGGHNLSHLTSEFNATAVDISPAMLENSRQLNPGVEHCVGDMRTVRLGRIFNAVLIHDAIAYLRSEDDLSATFMTARAHLEPGGVLLIAPDWFRETFAPGVEARGPRVDGGTELSYVEYVHDPDPADTTIESVFVYLIKTAVGFRSKSTATSPASSRGPSGSTACTARASTPRRSRTRSTATADRAISLRGIAR